MTKPKPTPNKALTRWLRAATTDQKEALAKRADTSVEVLRHYAAGRRKFSAGFAHRLASASAQIDGEMLVLGELCADCRACSFYRAK